MSKTTDVAGRVRQRLQYHFGNPNGGFNIPEGMPFMQEFLNEVKTLCESVASNDPEASLPIDETVVRICPDTGLPVVASHEGDGVFLCLHNDTKPEVGKGATMLLWTDRHAYEVMEVLNDGKRVRLRQYDAERMDDNGMSDSQSYKYEKLNDVDEIIVWQRGSWRKEIVHVRMTKEYREEFDRLKESTSFHTAYEKMYLSITDEHGYMKFVEGKTERYKTYSKVNIIFGVKDEHYDYTF